GEINSHVADASAARDAVLQNVRFTARAAKRRPLAAAVIVLTLALAIGGNAAIYSVARATLFATLPYPDAERVVAVDGSIQGLFDFFGPGASAPSETMTEAPGIAAAATYTADGGANLGADDDAMRLRLTHVSGGFFDVLGAEPMIGRALSDADDDPALAVLSYDIWTAAFGRDRAIVGGTIRLNERPYRVIGVMPPGVGFPGETDVWLPMPPVAEFFGMASGVALIARLSPVADRAATEAILRDRTRANREELTTAGRGPVPPPVLRPLREHLYGPIRRPLGLLAATAGLVLLLGCINLSGLTISTLSEREPELRTRRALGASRRRIFGQLLTEVLILSLVGSAGGILLGASARGVLLSWLPADAVAGQAPPISAEVALLCLLASIAAGLVIGTVPAARAAMRAGAVPRGSGTTRDRGAARLQAGLAVVQVALAIVLVVGAGLTSKSLARLHSVPLGFDTDRVLTFEASLPLESYQERNARNDYVRRARERLSGLPGVQAVGVTTQLPMADGMGAAMRVRREDQAETASVPSARMLAASPEYFEAMGTRVIRGRAFDREPVPGERPVVIDEVLARELFAGGTAIGERVRVAPGDTLPWTVVGVIEHIEMGGPEAASARGIAVRPLSMVGGIGLGFAVRTRGNPRSIASAIPDVMAEVDPRVPPYAIRTTGERVAGVIAARRAVAAVAAVFGAAAALLAALGLYGLLARGVAQRRAELGVRMALGAGRRTVLSMILASAARIGAAGAVAGIAAALLLSRFLGDLLFEVGPHDRWVYVGAAAVTLSAIMLASLIPARRAARLSPTEALRQE
ncbi:MAG: ADOP family duplicated permease, partial [Gemmatimonadota bacterium]